MDWPEKLGTEWDTNNGKYRYQIDTSGAITCNGNPEPHKNALCECDAEFARELGSSWSDGQFNRTLWGNKQNSQYSLDTENVCVKNKYQLNDECCGNYPSRFPYSSDISGCCGNGIFMTVNQDCCSDGRVVEIGSC